MLLTKIEIENYRGIRNKKCIDLAELTTIVGQNDSGKSLLLHALSSFLDTGNYKIQPGDFNVNCSGKPIEICCYFKGENLFNKLKKFIKDKNKKDIGIDSEVKSILGDIDTLIIKKTWTQYDKKNADLTQVQTKDFLDEKYQALPQKSDKDLDALIKDLNIEIPPDDPGRNSKKEKSEYIYNFLLDNDEPVGCVWREIKGIDGILPKIEFFQSDHIINTDTKFKTSLKTETISFFSEQQRGNTALKTIEEQAKNKMQEEAEAIQEYMQVHAKDLESIEIDANFYWPDAIKEVDVKLKFINDIQSIPMSHKGAGYRRLFMVGRFRYIAEKNYSDDIIYAIEEPETFLHPSAQEDLLDSINNISKQNQVLITTHSPIFAGATSQTNIILCEKEEESQYKCGSLENLSSRIIEELGIKPSFNMRDNFETIIFMEGPDDIKFLKIAAQKLGFEDFKNNPKKFLFLPGGGDSISNFVDIKYFSESGKNLVLILDGDNYDDTYHTEIQKSLKTKQKKSKALADRFANKENAKSFILNKKSIESYYHPQAIERLYSCKINGGNIFPNSFNVIKELEKSEEIIKRNVKGNTDIFNTMTEQEWAEVSNGELEKIIGQILNIKTAKDIAFSMQTSLFAD